MGVEGQQATSAPDWQASTRPHSHNAMLTCLHALLCGSPPGPGTALPALPLTGRCTSSCGTLKCIPGQSCRQRCEVRLQASAVGHSSLGRSTVLSHGQRPRRRCLHAHLGSSPSHLVAKAPPSVVTLLRAGCTRIRRRVVRRGGSTAQHAAARCAAAGSTRRSCREWAMACTRQQRSPAHADARRAQPEVGPALLRAAAEQRQGCWAGRRGPTRASNPYRTASTVAEACLRRLQLQTPAARAQRPRRCQPHAAPAHLACRVVGRAQRATRDPFQLAADVWVLGIHHTGRGSGGACGRPGQARAGEGGQQEQACQDAVRTSRRRQRRRGGMPPATATPPAASARQPPRPGTASPATSRAAASSSGRALGSERVMGFRGEAVVGEHALLSEFVPVLRVGCRVQDERSAAHSEGSQTRTACGALLAVKGVELASARACRTLRARGGAPRPGDARWRRAGGGGAPGPGPGAMFCWMLGLAAALTRR